MYDSELEMIIRWLQLTKLKDLNKERAKKSTNKQNIK